jgi:hypothetical protein
LFCVLVPHKLIAQFDEQLFMGLGRSGTEFAEALLDRGVILGDQRNDLVGWGNGHCILLPAVGPWGRTIGLTKAPSAVALIYPKGARRHAAPSTAASVGSFGRRLAHRHAGIAHP